MNHVIYFLWGYCFCLMCLKHSAANLTASLYFSGCNFLVIVVIHFSNAFGLTVVYEISLFFDL